MAVTSRGVASLRQNSVFGCARLEHAGDLVRDIDSRSSLLSHSFIVKEHVLLQRMLVIKITCLLKKRFLLVNIKLSYDIKSANTILYMERLYKLQMAQRFGRAVGVMCTSASAVNVCLL